jgi:SAM domain (Sterile alpha motif)
VNEIRTWLDGIGLAQYANAFESNDIDIDLLGQVDDQVLKDIGVSSAGHRLRIRNAIAKLKPASSGITGTELEEAKAPLTLTRDAEQAQTSGERRHVTVMFCDLVDSTGMAARLDAEEWRDLVGA